MTMLKEDWLNFFMTGYQSFYKLEAGHFFIKNRDIFLIHSYSL